jgi:hypothetical protein
MSYRPFNIIIYCWWGGDGDMVSWIPTQANLLELENSSPLAIDQLKKNALFVIVSERVLNGISKYQFGDKRLDII